MKTLLLRFLALLTLTTTAAAFLTSCQTKNDQKNKDEIITLQQQKIQDLEEELKQQEQHTSPHQTAFLEQNNEENWVVNSKYVFAVLNVEEVGYAGRSDGSVYNKINAVKYVTDIHEIKNYSDEKALRFKDAVKKNPIFYATNTKLKSIIVKEFSTYTEASTVRDQVNSKKEIQISIPYELSR